MERKKTNEEAYLQSYRADLGVHLKINEMKETVLKRWFSIEGKHEHVCILNFLNISFVAGGN